MPPLSTPPVPTLNTVTSAEPSLAVARYAPFGENATEVGTRRTRR